MEDQHIHVVLVFQLTVGLLGSVWAAFVGIGGAITPALRGVYAVVHVLRCCLVVEIIDDDWLLGQTKGQILVRILIIDLVIKVLDQSVLHLHH